MPAFAHRNHLAWWAFAAHRASGVVLSVFLPVHLVVLSQVLDQTLFDGFLAWARSPLVKASEALLVGALALHLAGGLRLLALEFLPWSETKKTRIAAAFGFAFAVTIIFLLWGAR